MAAARPLVSVHNLDSDMATDGATTTLPLPDVMKSSIRPDIVNYVHTNLSKKRKAKMEKIKWMAAVASIWIQCICGASYAFAIYSSVLKSTQGYDQSTLDMVSVFKDIGANAGILSGLLYSAVTVRRGGGSRPWVVHLAGAIQCFAGYFLIWLSVIGVINRPPVPAMCCFMLMAAHAQILGGIDLQMVGTLSGADFDSEVAEIQALVVTDVNELGETVLFTAADRGHLDVVKELLKYANKESISKKNRSGFDPLQLVNCFLWRVSVASHRPKTVHVALQAKWSGPPLLFAAGELLSTDWKDCLKNIVHDPRGLPFFFPFFIIIIIIIFYIPSTHIFHLPTVPTFFLTFLFF
ncbi:hypothetical protein CsSME_00005168 [Camellia sinensis var. sinensis]